MASIVYKDLEKAINQARAEFHSATEGDEPQTWAGTGWHALQKLLDALARNPLPEGDNWLPASTVNAWLTMALSTSIEGVDNDDLSRFRDYLDSGGAGEFPMPQGINAPSLPDAEYIQGSILEEARTSNLIAYVQMVGRRQTNRIVTQIQERLGIDLSDQYEPVIGNGRPDASKA